VPTDPRGAGITLASYRRLLQRIAGMPVRVAEGRRRTDSVVRGLRLCGSYRMRLRLMSAASTPVE